MPIVDDINPDIWRQGKKLLSQGHNPPRDVDDAIPTFEQNIQVIGGPGRASGPRTAGSWPWVMGSFTIGSNQVWNLMTAHFETNTPNIWILLRHNHSGSHVETPSSGPPGGTIDAWFFNAKGNRDINGPGPNWPLRSIRGPGTITLLGVGQRVKTLGSLPFAAIAAVGSLSIAATLRGYIM